MKAWSLVFVSELLLGAPSAHAGIMMNGPTLAAGRIYLTDDLTGCENSKTGRHRAYMQKGNNIVREGCWMPGEMYKFEIGWRDGEIEEYDMGSFHQTPYGDRVVRNRTFGEP
jgi:hypothetical protein